MIGLKADLSVHRNNGKVAAKIASDVITNGCNQERTLPPRFRPRIRNVMEVVRKKEPLKSNCFIACCLIFTRAEY